MARGNKIGTVLHYGLIAFLLFLFFLGIYFIFNTSSETVVAVLTPTFAPKENVVEIPVPVPVPLPVPVPVDHTPELQAQIDQLTKALAEVKEQRTVASPNMDEVGSSKTTPDTTDLAKCPDTLIQQGNQLLLYSSKQPFQEGVNPIKFNHLDEYIHYIKVQRTEHGQYCPVLYLQQETNAQGQDVYRVRPSPFNPQAGLPVQNQPRQISMPPNLLAKQGPNAFSNAQVAQQASLLQLPQSPLLPQQPVRRLQQTHPPLTPYVDAEKQMQPNPNGYYGFDPTSQYVGRYTVLDQIHQSTETQHPNTGLSTNPMDPNWAGAVYTNVPTTFPNNKPPLLMTSGLQTPAAATTTPIFAANTIYETAQELVTPAGHLTAEDPMNPNWAGGYASLQSVNNGDYAGNSIVVPAAAA